MTNPPPSPEPPEAGGALGAVRAAVVFLTRVPIGGPPYRATDWAWAAAHFPLVGLGIGAALGALHRSLWPVGPLADATLVLAASLLLTGALHEDGLADTSDALGGGTHRAAVLEILKDSRIGAYGACALLVSFVGRAALLARLGVQAPWALALVGCGARVGPVWQMALLPYVSGRAAKSRAVMRAGVVQAVVATLWLAAAGAVAIALHGVGASRLAGLVSAMAAVTIYTAWRYEQRTGGVTGDFLGATEQLCELAGYAVLAWAP